MPSLATTLEKSVSLVLGFTELFQQCRYFQKSRYLFSVEKNSQEEVNVDVRLSLMSCSFFANQN